MGRFDKEMERYNGTPRCRLCGTEEDITRHHLIPRRLKGNGKGRVLPQYVGNRCNIIILCKHHHLMIEQGLLRANLRDVMTPNERLFAARAAGRQWFDSHYPRSEDLAAPTVHGEEN